MKTIIKVVSHKKSLFIQLSITIIFILVSLSCEKDNETDLNKRITLTILSGSPTYSSSKDTSILISYSSDCYGFNINNYSDIDSIILKISNLKTRRKTDSIDIKSNVLIELFDRTHSVSIDGSAIVSDDIEIPVYVSSRNLVKNFPNTPMEISLRVINNNDTCFWELREAYLLIIKK